MHFDKSPKHLYGLQILRNDVNKLARFCQPRNKVNEYLTLLEVSRHVALG